MDLHDAYLGDQYPLCADLPPKHFLSKGARWSYLGSSPTPRLQVESMHATTQTQLNALGTNWVDQVPRVKPNRAASNLYSQLCDAPSGSSACRFKSEVALPTTLACHGTECEIDTVAVVDIYDPIGNVTIYYEYVRYVCKQPSLTSLPGSARCLTAQPLISHCLSRQAAVRRAHLL